MTVQPPEERVVKAIAALSDGLSTMERFALSQQVQALWESFNTLALDAQSTRAPAPQLIKLAHCAQAVNNIGMCLVTLSDVMTRASFTQNDEGALAGIGIGLDRAICHLLFKPYEERDFSAAVAAKIAGRMQGEIDALKAEVARLTYVAGSVHLVLEAEMLTRPRIVENDGSVWIDITDLVNKGKPTDGAPPQSDIPAELPPHDPGAEPDTTPILTGAQAFTELYPDYKGAAFNPAPGQAGSTDSA